MELHHLLEYMLKDCYHPHNLVHRPGFEPGTLGA